MAGQTKYEDDDPNSYYTINNEILYLKTMHSYVNYTM